MNLKRNWKGTDSKSVRTGPSSFEKNNLPGRGLTEVEKQCLKQTITSAHSLVTE